MLIKLTDLIDVSDFAMCNGYEITDTDTSVAGKIELWCDCDLIAIVPADLEVEMNDGGIIGLVMLEGESYIFSFKKLCRFSPEDFA